MAKKSSKKQKERLFEEKLVPAKARSGELFDVSYGADEDGPIECLGMTFENEAARREHFSNLLREKLNEPSLRQSEGFPIADDDDILALSDPPYYTACPNPFIEDLVKHFNESVPVTATPNRPTPFAADITEGKTDQFYNVHTYHTKVPFKAITRFILHYTKPGHVVLDGFCGTGMTGLAVQACANKSFLKELDPDIAPELAGPRLAILGDLSPAATHIAFNYNDHFDAKAFSAECNSILSEFDNELGWMFTTRDPDSGEERKVDYYVWSDIFGCPDCGHEIVFWNEGVDEETGHKSSSKDMKCPSCNAVNNRDKYVRVEESFFDDILRTTAKRQKEQLVLVVYRVGKTRLEKQPDEYDNEVLRRIDEQTVGVVPVIKMMQRDGAWGDMYRAGYHLGITHFHHFYYRRSLTAFSWLWERVKKAPIALQPRLRWWLQSVSIGHTRLNRYFASSYSQVNRYLKGFLYIAQVRSETAPWLKWSGLSRRRNRLFKVDSGS